MVPHAPFSQKALLSCNCMTTNVCISQFLLASYTAPDWLISPWFISTLFLAEKCRQVICQNTAGLSPPLFWAGLELKTTYFLCRNLKKWVLFLSKIDIFELHSGQFSSCFQLKHIIMHSNHVLNTSWWLQLHGLHYYRYMYNIGPCCGCSTVVRECGPLICPDTRVWIELSSYPGQSMATLGPYKG